MPLGVSWYSACCRVIFSEAYVGEIRNKSPAETPLTAARISFRRHLSTRCSAIELPLRLSPSFRAGIVTAYIVVPKGAKLKAFVELELRNRCRCARTNVRNPDR
jgi:hypothetical protein